MGGSSKRDANVGGSGAGGTEVVTGVATINGVGIAAASVHDARQSVIVVTPSGQHGQ